MGLGTKGRSHVWSETAGPSVGRAALGARHTRIVTHTSAPNELAASKSVIPEVVTELCP